MKNWTLKGLLSGQATTSWPESSYNDGQSGIYGFPNFDPELCNDECQDCIDSCPANAIFLENKRNGQALNTAIDYGKCINCQNCVKVCPTNALSSTSNFLYGSKNRQDLIFSSTLERIEEEKLKENIKSIFGRSLHIRHIDAGSCNGCESEIGATTNPFYNLHRFGIFFTPSPRFADVLLVTGPVVPQMLSPLMHTYEAMPHPKFVIAGGTCSISGAPFDFGYSAGSGVDAHLNVDLYIPGCPPSPAAFIHGLLLLLNRTTQKMQKGSYEQ